MMPAELLVLGTNNRRVICADLEFPTLAYMLSRFEAYDFAMGSQVS